MGKDGKSQAEDMDVRWKRHSIEPGTEVLTSKALCQTAGHRSVISRVSTWNYDQCQHRKRRTLL